MIRGGGGREGLGGGGGHKHKITDRPSRPKYRSVSSTFATGFSPTFAHTVVDK